MVYRRLDLSCKKYSRLNVLCKKYSRFNLLCDKTEIIIISKKRLSKRNVIRVWQNNLSSFYSPSLSSYKYPSKYNRVVIISKIPLNHDVTFEQLLLRCDQSYDYSFMHDGLIYKSVQCTHQFHAAYTW